ncbi:MAG: hypothetical protein IT441_03290 [Phycisphaeraceae bacterium]|nr:hypothetical protein [Phycisphaeraceae bacterium]
MTAAACFTSVDIGSPLPGKTTEITPAPGTSGLAYDVEGYGRMFGLHLGSDQGRFVYTRIKGDFEVTARVQSIHNDQAAYAEAGLMVRKDLAPTSLMLGQFVASNEYHGAADQYAFIIRRVPAGSIEKGNGPGPLGQGSWGNDDFTYFPSGYVADDASKHPRPFPGVWIRVRRQGGEYSGMFKAGDAAWRTLGKITLDLGPEPYVGMAVSANHHGGDVNTRAIVQYRELAGFSAAG